MSWTRSSAPTAGSPYPAAGTGRFDAGTTRTGELLSHIRPIATTISKLAFSGDGRAVLLGTEDGTTRIVDSTTGGLLGPPLFHRGQLRAAAFACGGRVVLTASDEDMIRAWNIGAGRAIGEPLSIRKSSPWRSAPTGSRPLRVRAEGEIRLWPLLRSLDGNPEQIAAGSRPSPALSWTGAERCRLLIPTMGGPAETLRRTKRPSGPLASSGRVVRSMHPVVSSPPNKGEVPCPASIAWCRPIRGILGRLDRKLAVAAPAAAASTSREARLHCVETTHRSA